MRKIASLFVALLLLAGCSSVPLTGRKQVLLVSDQEVLSSSLTQYNDYIKTAKKSTNANKSAMVTRVGKRIAEYRVFRKLGGGENTTGLRHGNRLGHRLPRPQRDTGHHSRRRYDLGNPPQRCEPREGDCRFITFYIKGKN